MATTVRTTRILVWDVPVRAFHWLLVAAFAGVFLTAESERLRVIHLQLGYAMAGLVGLRIVWGFVGSPYARFASFVAGPSAVWRYLRSVPTATPEHHVGHNPAGAAAMVGLMALTLVAGVTGWLGYEQLVGEWILGVHEAAAGAMMALAGVHVAGVLLASVRHRENLVGAMVTGWKRVPASAGLGSVPEPGACARLGVVASER